jgi:hypothetical protein
VGDVDVAYEVIMTEREAELTSALQTTMEVLKMINRFAWITTMTKGEVETEIAALLQKSRDALAEANGVLRD